MVAQLGALPVDLKPPSLTAAATGAVIDSQRKECQKHQCLPSPSCSVPCFCCKFASLNAECLDSQYQDCHNNSTSHCLLILLFFRAVLTTAHTWLQITAQLGALVANLKRQPQSSIAAATVIVIKITPDKGLTSCASFAFHC